MDIVGLPSDVLTWSVGPNVSKTPINALSVTPRQSARFNPTSGMGPVGSTTVSVGMVVVVLSALLSLLLPLSLSAIGVGRYVGVGVGVGDGDGSSEGPLYSFGTVPNLNFECEVKSLHFLGGNVSF